MASVISWYSSVVCVILCAYVSVVLAVYPQDLVTHGPQKWRKQSRPRASKALDENLMMQLAMRGYEGA
eukprot:5410151-Amphidinium_carterae.1